MANPFFQNTTDLLPATKARAGDVEANFTAVEAGFDEVNEYTTRTLRGARAGGTINELPNEAARASKVLSFDGSGQPVATITAAAVMSAESNAVAAAASAASAAASYDLFDDRFLGAKSADPSLDNDGAALQTGAIYWNTSKSEMRAYSGSAWIAVARPGESHAETFNGTGVQTVFALTGTPDSTNATSVFISGIRQTPITDYNISGSILTFSAAPPTGSDNILVSWTRFVDSSVTQVHASDAYAYSLAARASANQAQAATGTLGYAEVFVSAMPVYDGGVGEDVFDLAPNNATKVGTHFINRYDNFRGTIVPGSKFFAISAPPVSAAGFLVNNFCEFTGTALSDTVYINKYAFADCVSSLSTSDHLYLPGASYEYTYIKTGTVINLFKWYNDGRVEGGSFGASVSLVASDVLHFSNGSCSTYDILQQNAFPPSTFTSANPTPATLPSNLIPIGGKTPTNWRFADGGELSRVYDHMLFSQIGTTYGVGDGSTTFNVPAVDSTDKSLIPSGSGIAGLFSYIKP